MVRFESVGKEYGDVVALADATFEIPRGGIIGLLGPNGAGKTTTMRIMTGFLEATRGVVEFDGVPFGPDAVAVKRTIGYLPESAPVYGDMLAWDYLEYEAKLHGLDAATRVPEVIRMVGLQEHAHKAIRALSKGYRQRVGIAHTLLHDPELLVLDEPTSGLDPNQILEVRDLIRAIGRRKTVILSTHIMQEVEALCDRVILIHRGRIRFDGPIETLATVGSGGTQLRVRADGADDAAIAAAIGGVAGVGAVTRGDDGAWTAAVTDDEAIPAIAAALIGAGAALRELSPVRASVEQYFHELTREGDPVTKEGRDE